MRVACIAYLFLASIFFRTPYRQSPPWARPIHISKEEADDNLEVKTLEPEYPAAARAKGIKGVVRLRVLISRWGT
jgi:outer membrane biosynthesis protein TonB